MDGLIGRTPWHQDEGTMNKKGRFTDLVTVWIPFTKTNMLAVPKSNKQVFNHHQDDTYINIAKWFRLKLTLAYCSLR